MMPGNDSQLKNPPASAILEEDQSVAPPPQSNSNSDVAVLQPKKVQSAEQLSAQARRLSAASDVYFSKFLALLEEEVESCAVLNQQQQQQKSASSDPNSNCSSSFPALSPRFHACCCVDCLKLLQKAGSNGPSVWRALPDCITTTLVHSGLRIELLSCGAIHLTGPYLSLFIGSDSTTVVVTFHSISKVLLRTGVGGGGGKGVGGNGGDNARNTSSSWELDILSQPYTVGLRPGAATLTSSANLLTYCIDKAGTTKTKIVKQQQQPQQQNSSKVASNCLSLNSEEDQVLKAVQQAVTSARAKWQTATKRRIKERAKGKVAAAAAKQVMATQKQTDKDCQEKEEEEGGKTGKQAGLSFSQRHLPPLKYHRKWQLPGKEKKQPQQQQQSQHSQSNFWSFEDGLTIHDHTDGTLQLYYSSSSKASKMKGGGQSSEPQQANNNLQLLVNSQHLYLQVGGSQQVIVLDHTGHLFAGSCARGGGKGGSGGGGAAQEKEIPSPFNCLTSKSGSQMAPQHLLAAVCAQLAPTTAHAFDCHKKQVSGRNSGKRMNHNPNHNHNHHLLSNSSFNSGEQEGKVQFGFGSSPVFSLPTLLAAYEQYALGGPGSGLLVKHRHRRAGLNARNLICLL